MIWYKVTPVDGSIEPKRISRWSKTHIYLNRPGGEAIERRITRDRGYFRTWDEARAWLIEKLESQLAVAELNVANLKKRIEHAHYARPNEQSNVA